MGRPAQSDPSQSTEVVCWVLMLKGPPSTAKGKNRSCPRRQSAKDGVAKTAAAKRPMGRPKKQK